MYLNVLVKNGTTTNYTTYYFSISFLFAVISWEETRVTGENHGPVSSHGQHVSHNFQKYYVLSILNQIRCLLHILLINLLLRYCNI
jgi:hypothetical protein